MPFSSNLILFELWNDHFNKINIPDWHHSKECMCHLRNIAKCDNREVWLPDRRRTIWPPPPPSLSLSLLSLSLLIKYHQPIVCRSAVDWNVVICHFLPILGCKFYLKVGDHWANTPGGRIIDAKTMESRPVFPLHLTNRRTTVVLGKCDRNHYMSVRTD